MPKRREAFLYILGNCFTTFDVKLFEDAATLLPDSGPWLYWNVLPLRSTPFLQANILRKVNCTFTVRQGRRTWERKGEISGVRGAQRPGNFLQVIPRDGAHRFALGPAVCSRRPFYQITHWSLKTQTALSQSSVISTICFRYDIILRDGLPDWRQPVFYYRRVRKMGFLEFLLFIFVIFTIGHFIIAWSIYLERKFELVSLVTLYASFTSLIKQCNY